MQKWQGKVAWPQQNDSDSRAGKYWSRLVACAVVADACAPRATVADVPGAAWVSAGSVVGHQSTGIPYLGQGPVKYPYRRQAPGSAVALVGAVPHVPAGGTWEVQEEAVGPEGTPVAVVQQANVVLCHLDDPVHIASHNTPVVPAVAGAVAVLRFPLYLLYEYIFTVIDASFWCCHLLLLYVY